MNYNIVKKTKINNCIICGTPFEYYPSMTEGKYCSRECYHKVCIKNLGNRFTGRRHTKESMRKTIEGQSREKNYAWKGKKAKYHTIHTWVVRKKGLPEFCVKCGVKRKKLGRAWNLEWANIDHKYSRDLNDYIALCIPHHKEHDLKLRGKHPHQNEQKNQR